MMYELKLDPYSSHRKISTLLIQSVSAGRILDVGCNEGFIGRCLAGRGFELYGIDVDTVALEKASPYYQQVLPTDIERDEFPLEGDFDAVILADVLEHLVEPGRVLSRFASLLKEDGLLLVSLPNVANWYIRLNLLLGRFDYSDRGIMDRTHLRFFTLRTARALLEGCGFSTLRLTATPLPLPLVWPMTAPSRPLYFLHVFGNWLAVRWKSLFAYQFVFVARKRPG